MLFGALFVLILTPIDESAVNNHNLFFVLTPVNLHEILVYTFTGGIVPY